MARLYTAMKIFHFPDKVQSLPLDRPEILAPVHVRIKPTNVCNHGCRYCAYRAAGLQLGQDMDRRSSIPREKMLEIAEDLADMGVRAVTFSGGGEPLCYPHLVEAATLLADRGLSIASLTNGSLLRGEAAEFLAHRASWVRVSMDGYDGPSYARFRGVAETEFAKVLDNLAGFKRRGGSCLLGVNLIVGRDNADHVQDLVLRLARTGVDSVKISPCIVSNDGRENNDYHRPFFAAVRDQIARARKSAEGPGFEIYDSYHELEESFAKPYGWCPYCQVLPVIGADLNVYTCQDKAYNLATGLLGSIAHRRFREFWFADKAAFGRVAPNRDCANHCVADRKNRMLIECLEADPGHLGFV